MEVVRKLEKETLLLIVLCLAAFFVNNSMLPTDSAEAKTIVTARDIVAEDNWLSPTMNGESRLDKPPLAAWIAAVAEQAYPGNISVQRSVCAVMATLWALFFYGVARYMERRRGFAELATVVFLTCYNVIYHGRTVNRDVFGYSLMMGAVYFLFRMLYDERYYAKPHKWRWAALAGLMMGLSYLGNGTEPFYSMLLPVVAVLMLLKRPDMSGKWMPMLTMLVLCIAIAGWWVAHLVTVAPDSMLTHSLGWFDHGSRRPWYYYWRFFAEMGIWAPLTLAALCFPYWYKRLSTRRLYLMALSWLIIAWILLSIVPKKEMTDLLALVPPCALVVACLLFYYVRRWPDDKWGRALFYANGGLMTLLAFGMPVFVHIRMTNWDIIDFGTAVFITFFLLGIAFFIMLSTSRRDMASLVKGVMALFFVIECFMLGAVGKIFLNSHQNSIALLQKSSELKGLPIYYNQDEELRIEVVYAANKRIAPLNLNDAKAVAQAAPCLLLTQKKLASELPASVLQSVDTLHVGIFDDNRLPRHNKHYDLSFVNYVTVLRPKAPAGQAVQSH